MELESLRDLVVVLAGIVFIAVMLFAALISYSIYKKANRILKSAEASASKIEALTTIITDGIGSPLIQAASLIQAIACQIRAITGIFKKEGSTNV